MLMHIECWGNRTHVCNVNTCPVSLSSSIASQPLCSAIPPKHFSGICQTPPNAHAHVTLFLHGKAAESADLLIMYVP